MNNKDKTFCPYNLKECFLSSIDSVTGNALCSSQKDIKNCSGKIIYENKETNKR